MYRLPLFCSSAFMGINNMPPDQPARISMGTATQRSWVIAKHGNKTANTTPHDKQRLTLNR